MNNVVRIKKVEELDGTYYFPQKRVWVTKWFTKSRYEWVDFFLVKVERQFSLPGLEFVGYNEIRFSDEILDSYKNIDNAKYDCSEYMRIYHGDKVVKTWSIENE